jgi:hypothetical protein
VCLSETDKSWWLFDTDDRRRVFFHRITPRSTNKVSPESTPRGGGADRLDDTALSVASLPPPTLQNAGIGFSVTPVQPSPILAPQGVTTPSQASASSASYARPLVGLPLSLAWSDAADKEEAREERAEAATERAGGEQDSAVAKHQDYVNAKLSPDANLSARAAGPTCVDPCALMTSCPLARVFAWVLVLARLGEKACEKMCLHSCLLACLRLQKTCLLVAASLLLALA